MPSVNYFLDRTQELCAKIQKLRFKAPGIFTNSFIAEPSITTLLKDAEPHELALYRIKKPLVINSYTNSSPYDSGRRLEYKPERADGKSYYVDQSFNEYTNGIGSENASEQVNADRKRTAVSIPEVTPRVITTPPSSKRRRLADNAATSSPIKLLNLLNSNTHGIDDICKEAINLIRRYPNLVNEEEADEDTIVGYRERYLSLVEEITSLEEIIERQSAQLSEYTSSNESLLMSSPLRAPKRTPPQAYPRQLTREVDIDEMLEQEEREIRELEATLELLS